MGNIQKACVQEYLQEFEKKGYIIRRLNAQAMIDD